MHKLIEVDGRKLVICGREGDQYFDTLVIDHPGHSAFLRSVRCQVQPNASIIDIGANIGVTSSILAARAVDGMVHSIEPGQTTFKFLQETLAANRLSNCTPHQLAVGRESGEVGFYVDAGSGCASHMAPEGLALGSSNSTVIVKTLDELVQDLKLDRLDFLKVDVEGFELDVLIGGERTIMTMQPDLMMEINAFTLIAYGNVNPRSVVDHLFNLYPHIYAFNQGEPYELNNSNMLGFIHSNLILNGCVDDVFCSFRNIDWT